VDVASGNNTTVSAGTSNVSEGPGRHTTTALSPPAVNSSQVGTTEAGPPPPPSPPPPYSPLSGADRPGFFLPYVTQELPRYGDFVATRRQIGDVQLGFLQQSGGQYVPIQIPGYISPGAGSEEQSNQLNMSPPPLLPHRVSPEK